VRQAGSELKRVDLAPRFVRHFGKNFQGACGCDGPYLPSWHFPSRLRIVGVPPIHCRATEIRAGTRPSSIGIVFRLRLHLRLWLWFRLVGQIGKFG
jgi:hypothetical protein